MGAACKEGNRVAVRAASADAVGGNRIGIADYRNSLAQVVQTAAVPYGLTLSTWGAGATIQHFRGMPDVWQVFLFAAGGIGGHRGRLHPSCPLEAAEPSGHPV